MQDEKFPPLSDYNFAANLSTTLLGLATSCVNLSKEEIYHKMNKALYEACLGKHYDERIAKKEIGKLTYRDINGEEHRGEHWSVEKTKELTSKYVFGDDVTDWDKYVAFNYVYSKFCCLFNYEQIIAIGHLLFFVDGTAGKIWDYMGMNK